MQPIKKTIEAEASQGAEGRGTKARAMLKAQLGEDIYSSWFNAMEFDGFHGRVVKVSVPVSSAHLDPGPLFRTVACSVQGGVQDR